MWVAHPVGWGLNEKEKEKPTEDQHPCLSAMWMQCDWDLMLLSMCLPHHDKLHLQTVSPNQFALNSILSR